MAAERSSLKRKPLADCTNTIAAHADTVRRKPSLRSAQNKPLRSSPENNTEAPTGSLKSNTSTGSNNPPVSTSVYSTLLPASHEIELQDAKKRKDKGKAVVEYTTVLQPEPPTPLTITEAKKRKDKGKAVVEYTTVLQPEPPTPLTITEAKKRKDKGKAVVEYTTVLQPEPPTPLTIKLSSALPSDESEKQEARKRKDKGKAFVVDTTVLQPEPPTLLTRKLLAAPASDVFKCRTVYTRKRFPEARNLRSLKTTEPFSCLPVSRLKDKGKQVDDGVGDRKFRMLRDSFPAHKKQTPAKPKREKAVDAMSKEEVEKLRAYYADIDAFELEVDSDDDLD